MTSIQSKNYDIHFGAIGYAALNRRFTQHDYSSVFILVDTNTHQYCLPFFMAELKTNLPAKIIEIKAGEQHKNIAACIEVWNTLSELGADRKSLIINLGGGVVSDLGGFVAATFKRGIRYVNVPTTLLAMVDASVGGKTGIDLGALKNQVGLICHPEMILIDPRYLKTLAKEQFTSGKAEMLKHGLIANENYWNKILNWDDKNDLEQLIAHSVQIKNKIVNQDLHETGLRKTLNYGHTLGHAIESHWLDQHSSKVMLHGYAIAIGMLLETYLSHKKLNFPEKKLKQISNGLIRIYGKQSFDVKTIKAIIQLLKYDKKNAHGKINFVLLSDVGKPLVDQQIEESLIFDSFDFYKNLCRDVTF